MTWYTDGYWGEDTVTCIGRDGDSYCGRGVTDRVEEDFDSIWAAIYAAKRSDNRVGEDGFCDACEKKLAADLGLSVDEMYRYAHRNARQPTAGD